MSGNAALGRGVLGAYGAPSFAQAFIHGPAISVLQGIYAKFFGLSLQEIAFVILISRIFDAVNDPIVGFLSDRYRARHGTRKPWLLAGSLIAVIACWFLYVPSGEVTMWSFLFWYLLADIGWTVSEVPYSAWLAEISDDYEERARITTWRSMGRFLGLQAFFGLPIALQSITGSTEFTPETLRWGGGAGGGRAARHRPPRHPGRAQRTVARGVVGQRRIILPRGRRTRRRRQPAAPELHRDVRHRGTRRRYRLRPFVLLHRRLPAGSASSLPW